MPTDRMHGIAERLRRIVDFDRAPTRWALGLLIGALGAVLLWFALSSDGGPPAGTAAPSASGGDVVPPVEEGTDQATPPGSSQSPPEDVIPPAEP
jgi:hypothetical protein